MVRLEARQRFFFEKNPGASGQVEARCAPAVPAHPIPCQKATLKTGVFGAVGSFRRLPSNAGSRGDETASERVRQDFMWGCSCFGTNCAAPFSRIVFFTAGGWRRCCREEPSLARSSLSKLQLSEGSVRFGWTWVAAHYCDEPATALKGFKKPLRNLCGLLLTGGGSWSLYGVATKKKFAFC